MINYVNVFYTQLNYIMLYISTIPLKYVISSYNMMILHIDERMRYTFFYIKSA